jgi:DHA1 family tetracycline resistance protein-like MFS transporter
MKAKRNAHVMFIFVTILLDAIGLGLIIPIFPDVIRRFSDDPQFVNHYFGYFISTYALMQFIASPVLGSLSDRFGRRSILLTSLLGASLDYVLMALAPTMSILFLGRVISGLTGASMTVASSYIADVSDDSNRSANFGMIGAGFGLGFILGPLLGGLLGAQGHQLPFLFAAGLSFLNFIFGLFILPESLPPEKRRKIEFHRLNPFLSLKKILKPSPTLYLIAIYFLIYLAGMVHPSVWTLYTQLKFHWTTLQVGISLAVVGLSIAIVQGGLTRIINPKIGERKSLFVGLWFNIFGFFCFSIAPTGWMMYVILVLSAISGIAGPALQSMISANVPSEEQGELQGSLISLASITSIVGPLIYTSLFSEFTKADGHWNFPGISYFVASLICFIALFIYIPSGKNRGSHV